MTIEVKGIVVDPHLQIELAVGEALDVEELASSPLSRSMWQC
jgi:hypothetical protein